MYASARINYVQTLQSVVGSLRLGVEGSRTWNTVKWHDLFPYIDDLPRFRGVDFSLSHYQRRSVGSQQGAT